MPGEQPPQGQVQMKITDDLMTPKYSNLAQVACSDTEFFIDFMCLTQPTGVMVARIVVTPQHFKKLVKAFQDNLAQFETKKADRFKLEGKLDS